MKNIFAHTPVGPQPPFVSLNEMSNGRIVLFVRTLGEPEASCIELNEKVLWDMATAIAQYQATKATG